MSSVGFVRFVSLVLVPFGFAPLRHRTVLLGRFGLARRSRSLTRAERDRARRRRALAFARSHVLRRAQRSRSPSDDGRATRTRPQAIARLSTATEDLPEVLGPRLHRHIGYVTCVLKATREAGSVGERGGGDAFKRAFVTSVEHQMAEQVSPRAPAARTLLTRTPHRASPPVRADLRADSLATPAGPSCGRESSRGLSRREGLFTSVRFCCALGSLGWLRANASRGSRRPDRLALPGVARRRRPRPIRRCAARLARSGSRFGHALYYGTRTSRSYTTFLGLCFVPSDGVGGYGDVARENVS